MKNQIMRRIAAYMKPHKTSLVLGIAAAVLQVLARPLTAWWGQARYSLSA